MTRKASDQRRWVGGVVSEEPRVRRFVVWGTGTGFSDAPFAVDASNDIAEGIVRGIDHMWSEERDRWCAIVEADENEVDEWARTNPAVHGYTPYLAPGLDVDLPNEPMRGTLRSDVAPRRKVEQPRPD
jgi:hypothetical protein